MNTQDFRLNDVFKDNAKTYQTKPIIAAKYQSGMENGFMVHYSNMGTKEVETMLHEGIRFFSTEKEAWEFINANEKEYVNKDGKLVGMEVAYDAPDPVLYREDPDAENKEGIHFCFGEYAFVSDESCKYEYFCLYDSSWIIQEPNGTIRVWYPDSEETFFGLNEDIVYEKSGNAEYIKVAI